jgi:hypothetical protein
MTGTQLIEFILSNNLQLEELKLEYFSHERKLKFCGGCQSNVSLSDYHQGTSGADESTSSHYRFICKACFNKKSYHKRYKTVEETGLF